MLYVYVVKSFWNGTESQNGGSSWVPHWSCSSYAYLRLNLYNYDMLDESLVWPHTHFYSFDFTDHEKDQWMKVAETWSVPSSSSSLFLTWNKMRTVMMMMMMKRLVVLKTLYRLVRLNLYSFNQMCDVVYWCVWMCFCLFFLLLHSVDVKY